MLPQQTSLFPQTETAALQRLVLNQQRRLASSVAHPHRYVLLMSQIPRRTCCNHSLMHHHHIMANPAANLRSPKFERGAEPWPLPNTTTESICILAGREASAALCIALGKHSATSAAHQATYHEPFTFWDWHGVHPDDTYARQWKRQRLWEHHRGFTVDGLHVCG